MLSFEPLTVNIVSYHYGHLAAQAIESVLAQTHPPDVIRVFDDGAGDCGHLARLYPSVEVVERPGNLGIVSSMNDALNRTETGRCMMLGADNYLRADALEKLRAYGEDTVSCDLIITGQEAPAFAARVNASVRWCGYPVWRFLKGDIDEGNYIHGSSIFNTRMASEVGYRASGGAKSEEDWMLWRGMLSAGATHRHHQEGLIFYRRHAANFQK